MRGWEAIHPIDGREPSALGLRLVPVTLGHLFLLQDCGVELDEMSDADGLMMAAFICSQPHSESRKDLGKWWIDWFWKRWGKKAAKMDIGKELAAFQDWFNGQLKGPITKSKNQGSGDDFAAPLHFSLLALAMGRLNMSRAEALDCTVGELRKLIVAIGEAEGVIRPWTNKDERLLEMSRHFESLKSKPETAEACN